MDFNLPRIARPIAKRSPSPLSRQVSRAGSSRERDGSEGRAVFGRGRGGRCLRRGLVFEGRVSERRYGCSLFNPMKRAVVVSKRVLEWREREEEGETHTQDVVLVAVVDLRHPTCFRRPRSLLFFELPDAVAVAVRVREPAGFGVEARSLQMLE